MDYCSSCELRYSFVIFERLFEPFLGVEQVSTEFAIKRRLTKRTEAPPTPDVNPVKVRGPTGL